MEKEQGTFEIERSGSAVSKTGTALKRMMRFAKYHGCGNDFVIVNEAELTRACAESGEGCEDLAALARSICHRQLGAGADGLIICRPDPLTMDIINSDGSVAPMCGNGIRCFARHCIEEGIVRAGASEFDVRTLAGIMRVRVAYAEGSSVDDASAGICGYDRLQPYEFSAEVDMGRPDWSAKAAEIDEAYTDGREEFLGREVSVDIGPDFVREDSRDGTVSSRNVRLSSFFLGTYHTVIWLDENVWLGACEGARSLYKSELIDRVGRALESHPAFTRRTNVDFARVSGENSVEMITWERGAGLTAACGTGACSVAALGIREGRLDGAKEVRVALPYGELFIRMGESGEVFMRGPAAHVFDGEYYL